MHRLTCHMLDNKLLYLNGDLKKRVIHHVLLAWHQVTSLLFVSKFKDLIPTDDKLKYPTEE